MRRGEEILLRHPDTTSSDGRVVVAGSDDPCVEYVRLHRIADASAIGRLAAARGGIALQPGHPQQLRAIETHLDWLERKALDADQEAGGLGLSAGDLAALKPATRELVLRLAGEAARIKTAVLEAIARDRAEQESAGASDASGTKRPEPSDTRGR